MMIETISFTNANANVAMTTSTSTTTDAPTLLVLGPTSRGLWRLFDDAADAAALQVRASEQVDVLGPDAELSHVAAVIVDLDTADCARTCAIARCAQGLRRTPIIGVTRAPTELGFNEALCWGVDDVADASDETGLIRRLRALGRDGARSVAPSRGEAVVADVSAGRRAIAARLLRLAGYDVRVVISLDEVEDITSPALIVAAADIADGTTLQTLRAARAAGASNPWILTTTPRVAESIARQTASLGAVAVHDIFTPFDNLLFLANEMMSAGNKNQRLAARSLHGTRVWLRPAGSERDTIGFSYNVSEGGLFVRTLDPFVVGSDVWVELCPPRAHERVRLMGTIRHRRSFAPANVALSPPGVGIEITGGLGSDVDAYVQGCRRLAGMS